MEGKGKRGGEKVLRVGAVQNHRPRFQVKSWGRSNRQAQRGLSCWAQFSTSPVARGFQMAGGWPAAFPWPPLALSSLQSS